MSSSTEYNEVPGAPVTAFRYRDMTDALQDRLSHVDEPSAEATEGRISESEMAAALQKERASVVRETEQRLRRDYEQKSERERAQIATMLTAFNEQRDEYFTRVEGEVVQLALSIAAKILHREAQVDTMLVATLVRIAIEKLREGSNVTVRVQPASAASWRQYMAAHSTTAHVVVVEDAQLSDQDCIVETELGSANFGLDTQLKEVEQGFFDLLALRPAAR